MTELRILSGNIWTGDPTRPRAEAVLFDADSGTILEVRDRAEALRAQFPDAATEALPAGSLLIPAFHDAHNHWGFAAFARAADLGDARDAADAEARLAAKAETRTEGWLLGCRWNTGAVPDLASARLDRISTERPIAVFDKSTHSALLNRRAAELVAPAVAVEGARGAPIRFDAHKLVEGSYLIFRLLELPEADLQEALLARQRDYLSHGIATTDDLDVLSPQILRCLKTLYRAGKMFLPCHGYLDFGRFDGDSDLRPDGCGAFSVVGLKDYADGAFGAYSAALYEPFAGSQNVGLRLLERGRFLERWRLAESRGFARMAVHAIGDRAADDAIDLFAEVRRSSPNACLRLEHAQLLSDSAPRRLRELGVAVCMQPNFVSDVTDYADRLGDRVRRMCQHRTVIDAGVAMGFGSDGMPTGPLHGVACAVNHPNGEQRISVEDALRRYTRIAHVVSGTDDVRGLVKPGLEATFTLLDRDVVAAPESLTLAKATAVYLAGKCVFRA